MERDRKQIMKLLYLLAPIIMIWTAFCASLCYELGKNGLGNMDLFGVFLDNIPVLIIMSSMLFYGHRKYQIFSRNKLD